MKYSLRVCLLSVLFFFSCKGNEKPVAVENENGKLVYTKYCLTCHQSNGSGVPGMYPPLTKTDWVQGDKDRLIQLMLKGLTGEITVNGQVYRTSMPSHHYLTDEQIADVLTWVRSNFGNSADAVTIQEVSAARIQSQAAN